MKFLLDTHTLIWWLANDKTLSEKAIKVITNPDNIIFVSAASAWEIAIKKQIGKLTAPDDLETQIEQKDFHSLPINISHAVYIEKLPLHHHDPFDRIIIAQAVCEKMKIISRDKKFDAYPVDVIKS
ncbi:MAG: type II toxin-antitoxin system VapC family toxin [Richelia sp. RM2_1_2]|nr:type II toxin-antitoxin system VapC family toxin [Richelia sp. SM2_1_7]NJM18609.1 type II toxin-antitoxin system VapC family toxin [Richelia sp. SM1_7_0]NJN07928.1 type II toxin-antitoxin system VapC family toxin [Richelia sp. RM1_1_1]NJO26707.1 type II toxin-antitoxin system VapC family toxin [Richelia sp. SL_2_1]NJO57083.1 type II toxin-antitoxin system VapC family toxin [Richelia sp. RM2_1_2]NJS16944.1 type II toxin-antitoxin system VapC family toxin [Nostocaceae cyanobacterium CSU_2_110